MLLQRSVTLRESKGAQRTDKVPVLEPGPAQEDIGPARCKWFKQARRIAVANHLSDAGFGPSYVSLRTLPGRNLRAETCSDVGCRLVIRVAFHPGARNC
jgi:hypothetical protein